MPLPVSPAEVGIYSIAYILVVFGPMQALRTMGDHLWRIALVESGLAEKDHARRHNKLLPAIIGAIERPLFLASLCSGHPDFIGLWFAFRTVGSWSDWAKSYPDKGKGRKVPGRTVFNTFTAGAATSLLFALSTYVALQWALAGSFGLACTLGIGSILLVQGLARLVASSYAESVAKAPKAIVDSADYIAAERRLLELRELGEKGGEEWRTLSTQLVEYERKYFPL